MSRDALEYFYGITPERLDAMRNTPPPKSTDEAWKEHYRLQEEKIEELEREIIRLNYHINRIESVHASKDNQICNLLEICRANGIEVSSQDLINGRTSK